MKPAPRVTSRSAGAPRGRDILLGGAILTGFAAVAFALAGGPAASPVARLVAAAAPAPVQAPAPGPMVPRSADDVLGEGEYLLGPALSGFETAAFLTQRGGALAGLTDDYNGEHLTAAQAIDQVTRDHSISPRLIVALLEALTGGVDDPTASTRLARPFGTAQATPGFQVGLRSVAAWLDDGYYGARLRGLKTLTFADGSEQPAAMSSGAGHFAVARLLAMTSTPAELPGLLARFADAYHRLFGDIPAALAGAPPDPPAQPPLLFPWADGQTWHFTGGPHGAWGIGTAWGAVDFAPPSMTGCQPAPEWAVAAAPGVVTRSERGIVAEDLDGDGFEGTGWVLLYLHMATNERVPVGTHLAAGDRVGHPSCEGGKATGAHVHFARRYNGQWLPAAGGSAPLALSGWTFEGGDREYDGAMSHAGEVTRNAVTSGRGGRSDIVSDNGPARWAELAAAWSDLRGDAAQVAVRPPESRPDSPAAPAIVSMAQRSAQPTEVPVSASSVSVASPTAVLSATQAATLVVVMRLPGRRSQATPFGVLLERAGGVATPLLGRTDTSGQSAPITLPPLPAGTYDVTIRVPGFRPRQRLGVALGAATAVIDVSQGGFTPLQGGELTNDDSIDGHDVLAWLALAVRHAPAADVDGDGGLGAGDMAQLLANWGGGAPTVSGAAGAGR